MPKALSNREVGERLHSYSRDNYLFLSNVTKGVVLATATTILLQVIADWRTEWLRITPWLTSFACILVTYTTWGIGSLLSNARSNILDSLLPLAMGVAEFLLFGILLKPEQSDSSLWLNWFACVAAHSSFGFSILHNRIRGTDFVHDFEDREMSKLYESWLRRNRIGAFVVSCLAWIVWLALHFWINPYHGPRATAMAQFCIAIPFLFAFSAVSHDANRLKERSDGLSSPKQAIGAVAR